MRWRRTKRGIHLSYCSTHPEFRPKSAITEALRQALVVLLGKHLGHGEPHSGRYLFLGSAAQRVKMEAAKAVLRTDNFKAGEGVLLERDFGLCARPEQASQVSDVRHLPIYEEVAAAPS